MALKQRSKTMKEMIGGCCVCLDDRGFDENPIVYCDGNGCTVAVHQGLPLIFLSIFRLMTILFFKLIFIWEIYSIFFMH